MPIQPFYIITPGALSIPSRSTSSRSATDLIC